MAARIFALLLAATTGVLAQQSTASSAVDLSAPVLQVHASLPQMNTFAWLPEDIHETITRVQAIADQKGIAGADGLEIPIFLMTRTYTPAELRAQYEQLACSADAVVTGHTSVWVAHLNSSGHGIYTDYDFAVDTVIKDNPKAPLSINQHIVMARPGGALQLGTGTIKIINIRPSSFPHLETGNEYLIFVSFVPLSGGYQAADPFGSFIASGAQWKIMQEAYSVLMLPEFTHESFPTAISQWVASCK